MPGGVGGQWRKPLPTRLALKVIEFHISSRGAKYQNQFTMANTYTQLDIQFIFAVQGRRSLIHRSWKDELFKYMTGIVQNYGHKMLRINGMLDHYLQTQPQIQ